jgi:hypothetical protein
MTERCPHCYQGRLYKRGLEMSWRYRDLVMYDFTDVDRGPCPKCDGTGLLPRVDEQEP